jgi:hypothetical protein
VDGATNGYSTTARAARSCCCRRGSIRERERRIENILPGFLDWPQMLARSDTLFTITYGGQHEDRR